MRLIMKQSIVLRILVQALWISCIFGKVEPGERRMPFQYRLSPAYSSSDQEFLNQSSFQDKSAHNSNNSAFSDNSERHKLLADFTRTFIASANLINPRGFDFSKVNHISVTKRSQDQYAPVIPLLWVNLPHLDMPIYENALPPLPPSPLTLALAPPPRGVHPNDAKPKESLERDNRNFAIKPSSIRTGRLFKDQDRPTTTTIKTTTTTTARTTSTRSNDDFLKEQERRRMVNEYIAAQQQLKQSYRDDKPYSTEPFAAESKNQGIQSPETSTTKSTTTISSPESEIASPGSGQDYNWSYSVSDPGTKDMKSHSEKRSGDSVSGEYSVLEPDGYTRVVSYTADAGGFKATVRRIPPS